MFFVDDGFYSSEPVTRIPRAQRPAAVGLWTLAGTWSRKWLKDGYVPEHMIDELGGTPEIVDLLVDVAKLWKRKRGGGYQFLEWEKWQDPREKVEKKRGEWRDRQNRRRSTSHENTGDDPTLVTRDSPPPLPHPDPQEKTDDNHRPSSNHKSESTAGDNPVDYPGLLAAASAKLTSLNGSPITVAQAGPVVDLILDRGGSKIRNARRYVLGVLRDHGHEWLNYIHTGKEPE